MDGKLVTNQVELWVGFPHKRVKVSWLEVPESEDGLEEWAGVEAANRSEVLGLEKASGR